MWGKHTKPSWAWSDFTPGTWPTNDALLPPPSHIPRGRSPTQNQTWPTRTGIGAKIGWQNNAKLFDI